MGFNERIVLWQPFFITVATVAGTLVGLLFISLSINRELITSAANRPLYRLARRSFADFIYVMLIALFFLIPLQDGHYLGMELLVTGVFRVRTLFLQVRSLDGSAGRVWQDSVREYVLPVLSTIGLAIAGIGLYQEKVLAVNYFIMPVIATLIVTACANAWLLLIMEKK